MFRLSVPIYIGGGVPTAVVAEEVEWDDVAEEWSLVAAGNSETMTQGSVCTFNSDLRWYHVDIDDISFYSVYADSVLEEGYEGIRVDGGDNDAIVASMSSHIADTDNPHSVVAADLGLGNVENKSAATIISEIGVDDLTTRGVGTASAETKVYQADQGTGNTTWSITEATMNTALGLQDDWYCAPNVIPQIWFQGTGELAYVEGTNITVETQTIQGATALSSIEVSALDSGKAYRIVVHVPILYIPVP